VSNSVRVATRRVVPADVSTAARAEVIDLDLTGLDRDEAHLAGTEDRGVR
jgi:hypothetical protein